MKAVPSVLSLSYDKFSEQLSLVNDNAEYLHFDVMDGHFVPNLSFGPDILKTFRRNTELFLDVHLMVSDPDYFSGVFMKAGADGITFHYEAYEDIEKCRFLIRKLKANYLKAGISIKPDTNVSKIYDLLSEVDLVLVMSVEPGFGGQSFIPSSLDKIKELDRIRNDNHYSYLIEIDGGVDDRIAHDLANAGVDLAVAGSYVFKNDIVSAIRSLNIQKIII